MQRKPQQRLEAQVGRNVDLIGQRRVERAGSQPLEQRRLIALRLAEFDLGVGFGEAPAQGGQKHLRDRLDAADGQGAADTSRDLVGQIVQPRRGLKRRPRLDHHPPARLGQGQALRMAAHEQLQAELLFKLGDRGRDGRRRDIHTLGCDGNRPGLSDRDEVFELAQGETKGHGTAFGSSQPNPLQGAMPSP